jgi:hypothetical protein
VAACLLTSSSLSAQNLEQIGVKKGVKLNGSLNLNTLAYAARGMEQRRDPFNWFLTGNLNVNLFGYSAPFTFSYSNAGKNYTQPFNQFSFAPQYKWVKTYIGYNALTFSPYTLAGHVFLGAGLELTPGKWKMSAMYGQLKKAVPFPLSDSLASTQAAYKRMGYGLKLGYEQNGNHISANIFAAKDDPASLPFVLPGSQLAPRQNVALSLSGRKTFFKRCFLEAEYAVSALNNDTRGPRNDTATTALPANRNLIQGLLPQNATSRYFDALTASLGYQAKNYGLQLRYERVAPEYQTLGAYYFNNDMRNITVVPSLRLWQNRLTLGANVGLQENNLDESRAATTRRVVGAFNATYVPNELWNLAANYSNFSSYTNVRPQPDPFLPRTPLDTLNFYQVSQTGTGTVLRSLGSKEAPQTIMLMGSYQKASDQAAYSGGSQQSAFLTLNMAYSYAVTASQLSVSLAGNLYANQAAGVNTTYWGPTISATKALREKGLRTSLASSYNATSGGGVKTSPVLNTRLSISYAPQGKKAAPASGGAAAPGATAREARRGSVQPHSLSLGLNVLNRLKSTETQTAFTELTATLNYAYSF